MLRNWVLAKRVTPYISLDPFLFKKWTNQSRKGTIFPMERPCLFSWALWQNLLSKSCTLGIDPNWVICRATILFAPFDCICIPFKERGKTLDLSSTILPQIGYLIGDLDLRRKKNETCLVRTFQAHWRIIGGKVLNSQSPLNRIFKVFKLRVKSSWRAGGERRQGSIYDQMKSQTHWGGSLSQSSLPFISSFVYLFKSGRIAWGLGCTFK